MKSRLKVAFDLRFYSVSIEDVPQYSSIIIQAQKRNFREMLKKKSIRVSKWKTQYGHIPDDINRNAVAVVCSGWGFKVPRIVKNMLLKKHTFE